MQLALHGVEILQRQSDVKQSAGDFHLRQRRAGLEEAGVFGSPARNVLEVVKNIGERADNALGGERDAILRLINHLFK